MTRREFRSIPVVAWLGLFTACSGGDSSGPEQAPIASIAVSPSNASLIAGETQQLAATLLDNSGKALSGRTITWSSSNPAVAAVTSGGLVATIAAGGPITITASSGGKSGTASINVLAAIASVTVTPPTLSVAPGASAQLTATPRDASGNPINGRSTSWSSSNPAVATVSASGVVTGVAVGSAVTITASSEGKSGTASVSVFVPVASVVVAPAASALAVGSSLQLTATPRDANNNTLSGRVVTWLSGNPAVASVSNSGLITGVSVGGPVTITASSEGRNGFASVTVTSVGANPCLISSLPSIAIGTPINGVLATTDCRLSDGSFVDFYVLTVATAVTVQIDMSASFDTYLALLSVVGGTATTIATDDDGGPGTDSRISRALAPGTYVVAANSVSPAITGPYQLSVVQVSGSSSSLMHVDTGQRAIGASRALDLSRLRVVRTTSPSCGDAIGAAAVSPITSASGDCFRKVKQ